MFKLLVDAAKSAVAAAHNIAQSTLATAKATCANATAQAACANETAQGGTKAIQTLLEVLGAGTKYAEVTVPPEVQLSNVFDPSLPL